MNKSCHLCNDIGKCGILFLKGNRYCSFCGVLLNDKVIEKKVYQNEQ